MTLLGDVLMLLGALSMLAGAVGLHGFRDVYARLHVAGSATVTGAVPLLLGAALRVGDVGAGAELAIAALFLLLTTPAATQALARAAVRADLPTDDDTVEVDLTDHVAPTEGRAPGPLPHVHDRGGT